MRAGRKARVRIFVDYWNFANNWNANTGAYPDKNLDWEAFPRAILDALDEIPHLRSSRKELRAVKIYASSQPVDRSYPEGWDQEQKLREDQRLQTWFQDELDQLTAYTVDVTQRSNSPLRCEVCGCQNSHFVEQGVDTKIAIDLVALASSDLYEIAVLVTEDSDLVPSTKCVQDSIDKLVVHLGFKDGAKEVKTEAWGHLFVDDMLSEILKN